MGIWILGIGIMCMVSNGTASQCFQSFDDSLYGWTIDKDQTETVALDSNVWNNDNLYSCEISSPSNTNSYSYAVSKQMSNFQGDQQYYADIKVWLTSDSQHYMYIYWSDQISLAIQLIGNNYHIVAYSASHSEQDKNRDCGALFANNWNPVTIHANVPGSGFDYYVNVNSYGWVGCSFKNSASPGNIIYFGDMDTVAPLDNWGHIYIDSLRVYNTPQPDYWMNDYALSEDFDRGSDYNPAHGQTDSLYFWTSIRFGQGTLQVSTDHNQMTWQYQESLHIKCDKNKKALAKTPTWTYSGGGPDDMYVVWFYLPSNADLNFFWILYTGDILIVASGKQSDNTLRLVWYYKGDDGQFHSYFLAQQLSVSHWYRLAVIQHHSAVPAGIVYDAYLDHVKCNANYLTRYDYGENWNMYIGIDSANQNNYGEVYFDDLKFWN